MNIWNIFLYLLLGIGVIIIVIFGLAVLYVAQDDVELERERHLRDGT